MIETKRGFIPLEKDMNNTINNNFFCKQKKGVFLTGFSLIEALVGTAVFMVVAVGVYQAYSKVLAVISYSRAKSISAVLANEQFEIARNLPYADVGIISGIPVGDIPFTQTLTRDNIPFTVKTYVTNVDDPFDGTFGGSPNDTAPADYKRVDLEITCDTCRNFKPLNFNTRVSPKNLEMASTNGALFVRVFDFNGQPIQGASVHIENNTISPATIVDNITDAGGWLQLVDVPPGNNAYEITVSKAGYSTERTYSSAELSPSVPSNPHATVLLQQVTQVSFAIDKISEINVYSVTDACAPMGSVDFDISGTKIVGTTPNILKYNKSSTTNSSGLRNIPGLEGDNYNILMTDDSYDLQGMIPAPPVNLLPDSTQNIRMIVSSKVPRALLAIVKDNGTGLPVSGATVVLEKTAGFSRTLVTGKGFLRQTNWSGGSGQADFTDTTKYFSSDGNIEINSPDGELKLKETFGTYAVSGNLTSSTFDTGAANNFYQIFLLPEDQSPDVGADSVRFQLATNNDKAVWNFLGPDGTNGTYYTLSDSNISSVHNGDRYLRYKVFMQTASSTLTPNLADFSFIFSSQCAPSGQVLFDGLGVGADYQITVTKTGYQTFFDDEINISANWQQKEIMLVPE